MLASEQESVARDVLYRFSITLVDVLMSCFLGVPSGQLDAVWGEFHKARLSEKLHAEWPQDNSIDVIRTGYSTHHLLHESPNFKKSQLSSHL